MPKMTDTDSKEAVLLEKLLVLQLHLSGATQSEIAKFVGKSKTWVNALVASLPERKSTR
jgi:transcriptional regulator